MKLTKQLLANKWLKTYGRFLALGLVAVVAVVIVLIANYHHNHPALVTQPTSNTQPSTTNATPSTTTTNPAPNAFEQAFPNAKLLAIGQTNTDGVFSYKLTSVNTNYTDEKLTSYLRSLNPANSYGVPGTAVAPQVLTLVTLQVTNTSNNTCFISSCGTVAGNADFGCIYNSEGLSANMSSLSLTTDPVFGDSYDISLTSHAYQPNSSMIPTTPIYAGGTYNETLELASDCTALGNSTGTVYWQIK